MKINEDIKTLVSKLVDAESLVAYYNVLADPPNYRSMIECQFSKLYSFTEDYKNEVQILINHIRTDFLREGCKFGAFFYFFDRINSTYSALNRIMCGNIFFSFSCITDYVRHLASYAPIYNKKLDEKYFESLIDEIQLKGSERIIREQWKEIYSSEDGYKSFIDIFNDVFTNCMEKYSDKFFRTLSESDIICRAVKEDDIDKANRGSRYVPWTNAAHTNRWNPPGATFLYLSYDSVIRPYNKEINLNEYVCLLETRSNIGEKHSFCYFKPVKAGKILDLSYNDMTLRNAKNILTTYQDNLTKKIVDELLTIPNAKEKYKKAERLKADIREKMRKNPIDVKYIEESMAKQYLIMICNCIYQKVDETDDDKLDLAYKSFRILAKYLKSKGVTGIIYPCTRTNKIRGKNLVLFDINDAIPMEDSIKHIRCTEETFKKE